MGYQVSVLESLWCERVRDRTQAQLLTPISAYINMAYSSNTEGLEAALNASLERQRALVVEPTPKQIQKKWGSNLERVMVSLTAEVERIGKEMERGDHTVAECKAYIDIIHGEKMTLGKIFAQWQRAGGVGADTGVEKTVEAIEQAAENLIKNIRDTLDRVRPEKSSVPIPTIEQGASPKTAGIQSTPKQKKTQSEKSHFNNSREITTTSVTPTEFTRTASHAITTPTQTENSAYANQLISSRSQGSKKGSKRSSKAGSKASSAAKLKLKFDEVEAEIDAKFSAEATARSQRVLARNENKAEQERKRQAEKVEIEQRRQREQLESELRERRLREQLEAEQREQREQLEQEHRRHEEQLKLERERIEEEAAEREASIRKKEATIKAKKIALEAFIEENSVGEGSLSLGVTEIAPSEKVKAYVSQAVKFEPELCGQVDQYEVMTEPVTIPKLDFTNNIRGVGKVKCDYNITTNAGEGKPEPERVIKQSTYKPSKRSIGVPSKTEERLVKIPVETKSYT